MNNTKIGFVVGYYLSVADVVAIKANRRMGTASAMGGPIKAGDLVPLLVTKEPDDVGKLNGKLMLDGPDTFWVQGVEFVSSDAAEAQDGRWDLLSDAHVAAATGAEPETSTLSELVGDVAELRDELKAQIEASKKACAEIRSLLGEPVAEPAKEIASANESRSELQSEVVVPK